MNKALLTVGAIGIAAASAAVGWFGVRLLVQPDDSAAAPSATPIADAPTETLTFDAVAVSEQASGLFAPPACGEQWTADATPANGVIPQVSVDADPTGASATLSFVATDDVAVAFLGQHGQLIVTRDGVVVTPDWGSEFVPEYFVATPEDAEPLPDAVDFNGAALCDVAAELSAIWDDFDWANATDEEVAERQAAAEAFENENRDLPPGEYKVYAWTPVIVGEPAAAARALYEEGFSELAFLTYTAGYSPLADAPEIQPYCQESQTPDGATELLCDVPHDVLVDLLERDVPSSYIVDAAPGVAISEAATFTIE